MLFRRLIGQNSEKYREKILRRFREKGVEENDLPPEWYLRLHGDLWDKGGSDGRTLWDLGHTGKAVPVLLDWLEHLDERIDEPGTRWDQNAREGLIRALTIPEAKDTKAAELMIRQFHHDPPLSKWTTQAAAYALEALAGPEWFDQIAEIFLNRSNEPDFPLIAWLGKSRRPEAAQVLADRLDEEDEAAQILLALRTKKLSDDLKAEIRPKIERYLDHEWPDTRKQAKRAMDKFYPGWDAGSLAE